MTLTHRPVTAADIDTLLTFPQGARELFFMFPKAQYPLTAAQLAAAIAQRFDSTVFELDGAVVGFANFYQAEHAGICCIGNVVVAPTARGKGVATFIINSMTQLAAERHAAREVQLSCFNENTAGLLLYPRLGFVPFDIEERAGLNGTRVALVQMRQILR
ncbi:GNAT family N-acetyltransferase [Pseudomonas sp. SDI]|uniref:GNAT family N-acetyltransferase n=1 Tax=Pseudomonas sp. SDI TaxID=2170734 RepID=UPI000DE784DC|nr:GNAT family N-acetyltransferase [Pseudomonas sp. SDI]PWB31394.1 GNAT family N-acetyltransferase [Pseudomonas sp. SDI]